MNKLVSTLNDAGGLPSNVEVSMCLDCVHFVACVRRSSLSLSSHSRNITYNIQVVVAPTAIHVDLVKRNIRNDISGSLLAMSNESHFGC